MGRLFFIIRYVVFLFFISCGVTADIAVFSPRNVGNAFEQVRATFKTSMVALGSDQAPAPFDISCVSGKGQLSGDQRWVDDKTWVMNLPSRPMANIVCRFSTKKMLKDVKGDLVSPREYVVNTGDPVIENIWPKTYEDIHGDQSFLVQMNTTNPKISKDAYCVSEHLAEKIPLIELPVQEKNILIKHLELQEHTSRILAFKCGQKLPENTKISVVYGQEKKNFKTITPFKASVSCEREKKEGACIPFSPIYLNFSSAVPYDIAKNIRLGHMAPYMKDQQGTGAVDSVKFMPPPFPQQKDLELSLPSLLRDDMGRLLSNANKFPMRVAIGSEPALAKFSSGSFGIIEWDKEAAIPVTLRGIENSLKNQVRSLVLKNDQDMMHWLARVQAYDETKIKGVDSRKLSLLSAQKNVTSFEIPRPKNSSQAASWPFEVVGIPVKQKGLHVLELESKILGKALLDQSIPMYVRTAALVTNMAVHFKRGPLQSSVWVTTLDEAKPVSNAEVRVYDCQARMLWQGRTNKEGLVRIDEELVESDCYKKQVLSGLTVIVRAQDQQGQEDVSFVRSVWNDGIESWRFPFPTWETIPYPIRAHSILDRTLFRAGETLSMKHMLRQNALRGFGWVLEKDRPEEVAIVHEGSGKEFVQNMSWRHQRYAESNFVLPKDAPLGLYQVELRKKGKDSYTLNTATFRIEEFRLPLMTGRLNIDSKSLVAPRSITATLSMAWGNGGAASHWPVEVNAVLNRSYARPPMDTPYNFYDEYQDHKDHDGHVILDKQSVQLNDQGQYAIQIGEIPQLKTPHDLTIEAVYRDPNGEIQTFSRRVTLWPSPTQIGLLVEDWARVGKSSNLKILVLDHQNKPVKGKNITIRGEMRDHYSVRKRLVGGFYAWDHHENKQDLGTLCHAVSNEQGQAVCSLDLKQSGGMYLFAETEDGARVGQSIWVHGEAEQWFTGGNHDRMDLIPERSHYEPGETARLQVRMPFRQATAWLSIEREGILEHKLVYLSGKDPVIDLVIQEDWSPNVYVSLLAVRGRLNDVPWYSFFTWGWKSPRSWWHAFWGNGVDYVPPTAMVDLAKPSFKYGIAELTIGQSKQRLHIDVKPDAQRYTTRGEAQVDIHVRLPDGRPAPSGTEVVFAAVDESLLQLQPNDTWNILESMYGQRSYLIQLATAQSQVVGKRHYGRKALPPGGGGGRVPTRELFDTLLLWNSKVVLDAKGQARVRVPINDSLTRFRLVAIADVGTNFFGTGSAFIDVGQDIQLLSGLPPSVREGDHLPVLLTVRNGSDRSMDIKVRASADHANISLPEKIIRLKAGQSQELSWDIAIPQNRNRLVWTFYAQEHQGHAKDQLRINQEVSPQWPVRTQQATLEQVSQEGSLHIPLVMPSNALPGRGGVRVQMQSTLGDDLSGVRRWFQQYSYTCLEQRASIALGLNDSKAWSVLMSELPIYLDADGLAHYFPVREGYADQGSDVLTSYLLAVSHQSGYLIPEHVKKQMLDGLVRFVTGKLKRDLFINRQDLDARKLTAMEALSRHGRFEPNMLDSLNMNISTWSTASMIDWLFLLSQQPSIPNRKERLEEVSQWLRSRLTYQGTRLVLSGEHEAWWLMGNRDVNAARLLLAAQSHSDWFVDLPRLAAGLIGLQQAGHWQTTNANMWASLALQSFSQKFENKKVAGTTLIALEKQEQSLSWSSPKSERSSRIFSWPDQQRSVLNIQHRGTGSPWVTAYIDAAVPIKSGVFSGYSIEKTFEPVQKSLFGAKDHPWRTGDVVRVQLKIRAQADMTWVVVDDPIPAGASILPDQQDHEASYVERRFSGYRAYYAFMPKGETTLYYTIRLNQHGRFVMPPTRVEAMYAPNVYGALPHKVFEILK